MITVELAQPIIFPIRTRVIVRAPSDPRHGQAGVITGFLADDPRWRLVTFGTETSAYGEWELSDEQ